jgi:2-polyprenyl-6-methoxyphenol hydroxylase-like FAD-dependent oxidoreductase
MDDRPLIIGAGPVAALFLATRGVLCRIIDQGGEPEKESWAQVINPRSLELLEPTGVVAYRAADAVVLQRTPPLG